MSMLHGHPAPPSHPTEAHGASPIGTDRAARPRWWQLTPSAARLVFAVVVMLAGGITGNALLQHSDAGLPAATGTVHDRLVTGIRAPGSAPVVSPIAGSAIKTSGLPPVSASAASEEMKRWKERLQQLELEAQTGRAADKGAGNQSGLEMANQATGEAEPRPMAPVPAQRLDGEPVTPVSQQTVRAIQRELTERGYDPGPVDGNIGLLTQAAIMAFEHDRGLTLTGEPSERVLRQLVLGVTADDEGLQQGKGRDAETAVRVVLGVQKALASLKYAPGRSDGQLHSDTVRAIREFEMDQGLVPTGRVSGRLIVRLARASGKAFVVPVR